MLRGSFAVLCTACGSLLNIQKRINLLCLEWEKPIKFGLDVPIAVLGRILQRRADSTPPSRNTLSRQKLSGFTRSVGPRFSRSRMSKFRPLKKGEVQIRVHALGLNRAESMFRCGQYISIVEAHRYLESNQQIGKIVVTV
jgi:hypothetical protein